MVCIPGWKIIRTIGKGSFGTVYEIEKVGDFGNGVRSALKVISIPESSAEIEIYRDEGYDDVGLTALFKSQVEDVASEFLLMNRLKSCRNIVSYEDHMIVRHDHDIGYDIMIRMELLTPLPKFFEQQLSGTVDEKTVRKLGMDICSALERCARHNIIHRDIKPQNIFINEEGDFKLGDFGVARQLEKTATFMSKKGTYNYMAPEVYKGEEYGATCDIYSLGLVMYRMLNNGRLPFLPPAPASMKPEDWESAVIRRMKGEPLSAPKHGSEALKKIVLKACAFDPKDRYANPTEMKRDLEQLLFETTVGVFGGKSSAPEEPWAQKDEKTFGIFDVKPTPPEKLSVENDEKTFGVFSDRPMPPKEVPGPEAPKKPEPDRMKATAQNTQKKVFEPTEETGEKTIGLFGSRSVEQEPEGSTKSAYAIVGKTRPITAKEASADQQRTNTMDSPWLRRENDKQTSPHNKTRSEKNNRILILCGIAAAIIVTALILVMALSGLGNRSSQIAEQPTVEPTLEPTLEPTEEPTPEAAEEPMPTPTPTPTPEPTPTSTPEPTPTPTPTPKPAPTPTHRFSSVYVGGTLEFGKYEQDNDSSNGKEDIEWIVLEKEGNKALIISKYALDCQPYNEEKAYISWADCTLRAWLNGTFLNEAFTSEEKQYIIESEVTAEKNPSYSEINPGKDTTDQVFLLSIKEVRKYFKSNEARKCVPTEHAIAQGAITEDEHGKSYYKDGKATCWWWLRTPGQYLSFAADVEYSGGLTDEGGASGERVEKKGIGVRPAMWIYIGS